MPSEVSITALPRIDVNRFYVTFAWLLLALTIAGFAPTFFFRPFLDLPTLALPTVVHGVVLTGWFVLFLIQARLAGRGSMRTHRLLGGWTSLVVAAGAIGFIWMVLDLFTNRPHEGGELVTRTRLIRELTVFSAFPVLASLGIYLRRKPQVHKRLMLLASISLMGPVLSRLVYWPGVYFPDLVPSIPRVTGAISGVAALLLLAVVFDRLMHGRVHPTLTWGVPLYFAWLICTGIGIPAVML